MFITCSSKQFQIYRWKLVKPDSWAHKYSKRHYQPFTKFKISFESHFPLVSWFISNLMVSAVQSTFENATTPPTWIINILICACWFLFIFISPTSIPCYFCLLIFFDLLNRKSDLGRQLDNWNLTDNLVRIIWVNMENGSVYLTTSTALLLND